MSHSLSSSSSSSSSLSSSSDDKIYRYDIAHFPFHPQSSHNNNMIMSYLDADTEHDVLDNSLIAANKRINVVISHATRTLIARHLSDGCRIIHFSGHAIPDYICLEDDTIPGKLDKCTYMQLKHLFMNAIGSTKCPQIVVLAMCYSMTFADIFLYAGVQVVIGNHSDHQLLDSDGIAFMTQFYYSLLHGATVDDAFNAGKGRMMFFSGALFQMRKKDDTYNPILFPSLPDGHYIKYQLQSPHNIPYVPRNALSNDHIQSARSHVIDRLMHPHGREVISIIGPSQCGKSIVANASALYLSTRHRYGGAIYDGIVYIDLHEYATSKKMKQRQQQAMSSSIRSYVDDMIHSMHLSPIISSSKYLVLLDGAEHTYTSAPMHYAHTLHAYISDLLLFAGQCQVIVTSMNALSQVENLDHHIHERQVVMMTMMMMPDTVTLTTALTTSPSTTVVHASSSSSLSPPSIPFYQQWKLPQQDHRNITFIDRHTLLHDIHHKLMLSHDRPGVVTAGLGGVGKTQLALRYAHHPPDDYHYHMTAWFYAESVESLQLQYIAFAKQVMNEEVMKVDDAMEVVKEWFGTHHHWLIVYDNVTEPHDILPFLPQTHNSNHNDDHSHSDTDSHHTDAAAAGTAGRILITSRYQSWSVGFHTIQVGVMDSQQSLALVKASLGNDRIADDIICIELCTLLGHLPLAISYACAFIRHNITYTVSRYIDIYKSRSAAARHHLMEYEDMSNEQHVSVYNTWDMTMEKISTDNVMAVIILRVLACVSPDGVTKSLLIKCCSNNAGDVGGGSARNGSGNSDADDDTTTTIDTAITLLHHYSLIHYDITSHTLSMHRVLQSVIRHKIGAQIKSQLSRVMLVMNEEYDMARASVLELEAHQQQLFPHLQTLSSHYDALGLVDDKDDDDFIVWAITLSCLGHAYRRLGDTMKLKELYERVLLIEEHHYGSDHVEVATTLTNLGVAYSETGDAMKAKELHERALSIEVHHYGTDHVSLGATLSNLATAHSDLGDYTKSKELMERALSIEERHYGSDHVELAAILSNLGRIYDKNGDVLKAKQLYERALLITERHYDADHVQVATILGNLGSTYNMLDDAVRAKELLERALSIDERHYGSDHVKLATTLSNLGLSYKEMGDTSKAKELYERALLIVERHYGADPVEVATILVNLGSAYDTLDDAVRAKELLERALSIEERHYGSDHVVLATTMTHLSVTYHKLGNAAKAKELLERILVIEEHHYGADHVELGITLSNLATAHGDLGEYTKSKELQERALLIIERHYGSDHVELATTLSNLGVTYRKSGNAAKAKELLERALMIKERHYGSDHVSLATTLFNLSVVYTKSGDFVKAKELLTRVLTVKEHHYGHDHVEVATTLYQLGTVYNAMGESLTSSELWKRALPIFIAHNNHEYADRVKACLGRT